MVDAKDKPLERAYKGEQVARHVFASEQDGWAGCPQNLEGADDLLVQCVESPFTLIVIPGLTRNPVLLGWIPAFAGMTAPE